MQFGIFMLMQQRGYHQTYDQVLKAVVEQSIAADQAGFDTAWYAEHHFSNYGLCPSPLMMVAHMAGQTRRIRLGSAVCVLPMYHPARLLADDALRRPHGADVAVTGRQLAPEGVVRLNEPRQGAVAVLNAAGVGVQDRSTTTGGHLRVALSA